MDRYLTPHILKDLTKKMVFVGGPRQVGKTTLSLKLFQKDWAYLNWDISENRDFILQSKYPSASRLIFDEIHKYEGWRQYIKGLFDKQKLQKETQQILVTGSARLDYYRHSGDSLQGRYFYYRLHPLSVKELKLSTQNEFKKLLELGGFPEPYFSGDSIEAQRWRKDYRHRVVQEDISTLERSSFLTKMELALIRLPKLVGSPLSINGLREDLSISHKSMSDIINIFERLYLIYRIPPLHSNTLRAVKKEQKHYHFNWAEVEDLALRFENLIASHLLKWVHFKQDTLGENIELRYFRDTEGREVDFIILQNETPTLALECKLSEKETSKHLKYFKKNFPNTTCMQVHQNISSDFETKEGIKCVGWKTLLNTLV